MRKRTLRPVSIGVLLLIAGLSVVGSVALRRVVAGDERKLLNERGAEVSAVLESIFQQEISSARVLAQVALADPADMEKTFRAGAPAVLEQGAGSLGIARPTAHGFVVVAEAGNAAGLRVGTTITGHDAALLRAGRHAVAGMTALVNNAGTRRISLYLPAGHDVLFLYSSLDPRIPVSASGPFESLRGALYASRSPRADTLIMTTERQLPIQGGPTGTVTFEVGDDVWSLVYGVKGPLVDGWSANLPWLVLGAGLGLALLMAVLFETLARRQSYAHNLVDERTRSLQEANAELRAAEEAADRANRSKSEFLSRMSHELRTPLNAILGYAQILQMDPLRDDQEQPVEQILTSGRHLLELINEVLDISRIEVGRLTLSIEPVGVAEVMETALDMVRPTAAAHAISLVVGEGLDGVAVQADRQRLRQILLNMLSNAVKYNQPGGRVTVGCELLDGHSARISVTDTGPGIEPEHHELVFAPFERCGKNQAHVEGTGIGLALSRHLAEVMQGSMGLASRPGEGSTFWVDLPLAVEPAPPVEEPRPQIPGQRRGEAAPSVLLVEDNPANVGLVERALAMLGNVRVLTATSGRDALEMLRGEPVSAVLLDLHLPDLTGEQVLKALRDDPRTDRIPVVVVSADATEGQIERLLAAGATAYLTKPFDVRQLLDIVSAATAPATATP
ncbi:MAG TPA: ATP-binding protein [Mycobacteriales bacterium]|nr:ATP-binding protein [Mycobacteriales bacterium]